jgi:hypothetical protein
MFQKTFRLIALFFFISLILSPVYFKHIRHYVRKVNIFEVDVKNITNSFMSDQGYKCGAPEEFKITSDDERIQIMHFSSPKCFSCKSEVEGWRNLPLEIYNNIKDRNKKSYEIDIINIISEDFLAADNTKDFVQKMMTYSDENNKDLYEKIKIAGISTCVVTLPEEVIREMNIEVLPYSIAMKGGQIIYALAGQMSEGEIPRFAGIITKSIG